MSPHTLQRDIAAAAARLIVEHGLDHGRAKRRALGLLGLPARTPLPDNALLDEAVREHLALFCAHTQPHELRALREAAAQWMQQLADFHPHLTGAVYNGTATRHCDIWIQLFCPDPKAAEIHLINLGVRYSVGSTRGFHGREVDVLSIPTPVPALGETVGVHLVIYGYDDLRGARRELVQGKPVRGPLAEVQALLAPASSTPPP